MIFRRTWILLTLLTISLSDIHATITHTLNHSGTNPDEDKTVVSSKYSINQTRSFKEIESFNFDQFESALIPYFTDNYISPVTSEDQDLREKVESTYMKIVEEGRFVDKLDLTSFIELPVGINKEIGGVQYTIMIDSVVMTPAESFLYASMRFKLPQSDKPIHFIGRDIKFSAEGGLSGDGILSLIGDYAINLGSTEDENGQEQEAKSQLIIKGNAGNTNVIFDCNGYKQFNLDAGILFSRDLIIPEGPNGERLEEENVEVQFTTSVVDWNDILISVQIPRFQVTSVKDMAFSVQNAIIDLSDTRNAPGVVFPQGYNEISPVLSSGAPTLWRGVFIKEVQILLPRQFEKKDSNGSQDSGNQNTNNQSSTSQGNSNQNHDDRIVFSGVNMLIDNMGFSGIVSANNLIPIDKGKIDKWAFSLDQINVNLVANEISTAGFKGMINVPVNKEKDGATTEEKKSYYFQYTAQIKPGNEYLFNVSNAEKLNFDLWKADVTLNPTSYIEIKLRNGRFRPKAHLDGIMTMNIGMNSNDGNADGTNTDKNAKIAYVAFQDLEIQTVKPYVRLGAFSLGMENEDSKMGGFPIQINGISGEQSEELMAIGVDVTLGLIKESDGGFAARGKFKIISKPVEEGNDLKYKFEKIVIQSFGIDIDQGNFAFKGTLNFYKNDEIYGNGISGTVDATFRPTFQLKASAIFGTKDGERYFYVDALVNFESGIPLFAGLNMYGFGGGAYYGMALDRDGVGSPLGETASGMVYVPDATAGFGFKATVFLGLPKKEAMLVEATYEMAFNRGGGVKYISFVGNGYFFVTPENMSNKLDTNSKKLSQVAAQSGGNLNEGNSTANSELVYGPPSGMAERAQLYANVSILFDFENNTLHGTAMAFLNAAGGLIKGSGPNGKAGEIVFHFEPGLWYVYVGRPEYENRFGIEVLGFATLDSYFVIGSVIPDTPPPPPEVSAILGDMDLDYMGDLATLEDGAGFGFGASFRMDTGKQTFLIFYAQFKAGIGFDMMLKNYGDAECAGRGQLGLNGWYANAQAYAYFEGNVGIEIKVLGKRKKFEILEIGAAVVIQAKLPNPIWFRGVVGGYFSVLGGLVKGDCQFELQLGEECELIQGGSALETVNVIAQITPQENTKEIDVFTTPQAVFNYEMEKVYEMVDYDDSIIKFKIVLDKFELKDGTRILETEQSWNQGRTVAILDPFEILPSERSLSISVIVKFMEYKDGTWVVSKSDGEELKESKTIKFTTGKAPDHIPDHNVAYSYPTQNQFNLYKNEYNKGFITLGDGQAYLFEKDSRWDTKVRFKASDGTIAYSNLEYVAAEKEVNFNLPSNLVNDKIYKLQIVNIPTTKSTTIDENVIETSKQVTELEGKLDIEMKSRTATGTVEDVQEKTLYKTAFRTSRYSSFAEKVNAQSTSPNGYRFPLFTGVHKIGSNIKGPEPYTNEEIYGIDGNSPLILTEADLTGNTWYNNEIYPKIYEGYPLFGEIKLTSSNRDPSILGVVPTKAVSIMQNRYGVALTDSNINSGYINVPDVSGGYVYFLAKYMYYDLFDLRGQAAAYIARTGNSNQRLERLLTGYFPYIKKGDYWINLKYTIPGKNITTSTVRHKIYNPIN